MRVPESFIFAFHAGADKYEPKIEGARISQASEVSDAMQQWEKDEGIEK